ncbi:DNRLRE domain-containing protein [Colwellia sp. TT2012]|uniref:DNRLRE domain-containing protein n=1 Tax=Colwellia sp. TT2012 TaxID=1720342 RepID=UPI000708AA74|nr:DNRLRE domain-containing protein [Colwellia sp. TT2012]
MHSQLSLLLKQSKLLKKRTSSLPLNQILWFVILSCFAVSISSSAQSFKTSLTAANNEGFYQPNYPLIFVSAPIIETANKYGGVSGTYKFGTDVLSANNPSGGNKLWILLPNGQTKLLFPLDIHLQQNLIDTPADMLNTGSVVEPNLSEDGKTVYFSYFHNADDKLSQSGLPKLGADLYSINISALLADYSLAPESLITKRLTIANVTTNGKLGTAELYKNALNPKLKSNGSHAWGSVYMHPEEMRTKNGLKLIYVSDKRRISNSNRGMGYANHNFNLFSADINDDGSLSNHQQFQYYTTTSALSPNRLRDGIAFSYQATTEDARHWQVQGISSSGQWYPLFGYGNSPEAAHLSTFCVKEKGQNPGDYLITTSYYNLNNNGFGALHSLKLSMAGMNAYDLPQGNVIVPRQLGAKLLTKGVTIGDLPSRMHNGKSLGKFTTPRCGMADELFFAHTTTSANSRGLDSDNSKGIYRSYIGFRNNLEPFDATAEVNIDTGEGIAKVIADDTGTVNLLWPLPVLTWQQRSGDVEQTYSAPAVASSTSIQAGDPYAQVGTSALWNTDRRPFDCWLGARGQVPYSPNQALNNINAEMQELVNQSAGLNRVQNQADYCEYLLPENVLGIAINLTSNKLKGSYGNYQSIGQAVRETSRLLGVYSVKDQQDQSFKAIIPANVPFDFHLLDRKTGLKLTDTRSWHSLKPEESRTNCGGCHQHEKAKAIPFETTFAAQNDPMDMVNKTTFVDYDAMCQPEIKTSPLPSIETLEWTADIWPGFDRNCSSCHNSDNSVNEQALIALSYNNEETAYNMLTKRNFVNHTLGAIGSPAWWAARGERTDGRNNDLAKYQADYANHKWGFKHSSLHQVKNDLCDGNSPDEAKWVYKFGHWIDNFQHRDVGSGIFNTKLDRYHPTVSSSIVGACTSGDLHIGWWDDSGQVKHISVSVNGESYLELVDQSNGSKQISLGNLVLTDSIKISVEDPTGNTQHYQKSFKELSAECTVRMQGAATEVTAKPYNHDHDYTDTQTDIGTVLADRALDSAPPPAEPPEVPNDNNDIESTLVLAADIDEPIDASINYRTIELPVIADTYISQYNGQEKKMNFGGAQVLRFYTGSARRVLIKADLSNAPQNKKLIKASLKVFVQKVSYPSAPKLLVFKVTKPWIEGTKSWGVWPDGVTWLENDYFDHEQSTKNNWLTPGGDLDLLSDYGYGANGLIKRAPVVEGEWLSLDITEVVQSWLTSPDTNHGLLLRGLLRAGNSISIASRENEDVTLAPKIEYHYLETPEPPKEAINIESTLTLAADIDAPIDASINYSTMELPVIADTYISQYNGQEKKMNFGGAQVLRFYTGSARRVLIKADLSNAPQNKKLIKASLKVFVQKVSYPSAPKLLVFKVTKPWIEGTKSWGVWPDGVTWLENDYFDHEQSTKNNWLTPGGDLDLLSDYGYGANGLIKRAPVVEGEWLSLDITEVVQSWLTSPDTNHGLLLRGLLRAGNSISIASRENEDVTLAPKIEYHYLGDPI